jgi:hypothetical protein
MKRARGAHRRNGRRNRVFGCGSAIALHRQTMQIHVIGPTPDAAPQLRAYAEYRVFSRLAPHARDVLTVQVVMTRSKTGETVCAVCADLGAAGSTQARSRHVHPIRALDIVADKLAEATVRQIRGEQVELSP